MRQPLSKDDVSALPKRQRTGALHDAGAPPQVPLSLTPRFSGVTGGREQNSTVLTVSYRAQSMRRGKSARLCRRFPTGCLPAARQAGIADFQSAELWANPQPRKILKPGGLEIRDTADWKSAAHGVAQLSFSLGASGESGASPHASSGCPQVLKIGSLPQGKRRARSRQSNWFSLRRYNLRRARMGAVQQG